MLTLWLAPAGVQVFRDLWHARGIRSCSGPGHVCGLDRACNLILTPAVTTASQEVLLDPPNLMVPVPADPAKTKAAAEALAAFRARMKKDFEEQWANLTPGEQAAMRKQWQARSVADAQPVTTMTVLVRELRLH